MKKLILASGSTIRAQMLVNANVVFEVEKPRVDEELIKAALVAEGAKPRDIADTLAEMKARKVSEKHPDALVIGSDQVLDHAGALFSKPKDRSEVEAQITMLSGQKHQLLSAAVICENGKPLWRQIGVARMQMRDISPSYLQAYLDRNWPSLRHSIGGYKLEEEGVRLFSRVDGDYFTVLGMPLLEILSYLSLRGDLET